MVPDFSRSNHDRIRFNSNYNDNDAAIVFQTHPGNGAYLSDKKDPPTIYCIFKNEPAIKSITWTINENVLNSTERTVIKGNSTFSIITFNYVAAIFAKKAVNILFIRRAHVFYAEYMIAIEMFDSASV
ncbi:hypothetical protein HELRODRAFT_182490 [Helobdella robusta]|uniref:Ig-like domain-containing protein n=1 Tax=Helobdella robusta TaxID=6412 RepID=T1FI95_HELRO|nr:hypothetical protein HELRODRAFT_182490 [Helobdella robusta]ESN90903.1 hypothetical protein HELRODRAFT_182490 [Helobdella robusta]